MKKQNIQNAETIINISCLSTMWSSSLKNIYHPNIKKTTRMPKKKKQLSEFSFCAHKKSDKFSTKIIRSQNWCEWFK